MSANSVYQVDLQTFYLGNYITNVYHVLAPSPQAARLQAAELSVIQAALYFPDMVIDRLRVTWGPKGARQFISTPWNQPGTRTDGGQAMPLFCRWRVDFAQGFRRPCRKFLLGITESEWDGHNLTQAAVTLITQRYITPIIESSDIRLCGPTGAPIDGAAVSLDMGMRQLRRGSKRKLPVIS